MGKLLESFKILFSGFYHNLEEREVTIQGRNHAEDTNKGNTVHK